jgi:hypothetical protein
MKTQAKSSVALVSIAVLWGLADGAAAAVLTSPTGTVSTPTISAETEGHATLHNPIAKIECQWAFEGTTQSHGKGNPAVVTLPNMAPTNCTNSWHVTVVTPGSLSITNTSGYNGTVTWSGGTITATRFGVTCNYSTNDTHLGVISGGSPAKITIQGAIPVEKESSSAFCGADPTQMTGSYKLTSPSSLFVDKTAGSTFTSPTGTVSTPTIKAISESHIAIDSDYAAPNCQWSLEGVVKDHGGGRGVDISLSSLTTSCTDLWHATTVVPGALEVHWTSGYSGTIVSTGSKIQMTRNGIYCTYMTWRTDLGTITGGMPATIHLTAVLPIVSAESSSLCGEGAQPVTGSLKVTSPSSLFVDEAS